MATNLIITQGKTFNPVIRWGALPFIYKAVTGITKAAPASVTSPSHGLPNGWPSAIVSVVGMEQINAKNTPVRPPDFHKATVVSSSVVEFNDINSSLFDAYVSGGYLQYYTPVDLATAIARMTIRDRVGGTALVTLTSTAGGIALDNTNKTIIPTITAAATALLARGTRVFDLEMEIAGVVKEILAGTVTVNTEVTT